MQNVEINTSTKPVVDIEFYVLDGEIIVDNYLHQINKSNYKIQKIVVSPGVLNEFRAYGKVVDSRGKLLCYGLLDKPVWYLNPNAVGKAPYQKEAAISEAELENPKADPSVSWINWGENKNNPLSFALWFPTDLLSPSRPYILSVKGRLNPIEQPTGKGCELYNFFHEISIEVTGADVSLPHSSCGNLQFEQETSKINIGKNPNFEGYNGCAGVVKIHNKGLKAEFSMMQIILPHDKSVFKSHIKDDGGVKKRIIFTSDTAADVNTLDCYSTVVDPNCRTFPSDGARRKTIDPDATETLLVIDSPSQTVSPYMNLNCSTTEYYEVAFANVPLLYFETYIVMKILDKPSFWVPLDFLRFSTAIQGTCNQPPCALGLQSPFSPKFDVDGVKEQYSLPGDWIEKPRFPEWGKTTAGDKCITRKASTGPDQELIGGIICPRIEQGKTLCDTKIEILEANISTESDNDELFNSALDPEYLVLD